jgi:hypothetical protein
MDRALHAARVVRRTRLQHRFFAALSDLPEGAMILRGATAYLVRRDAIVPYQRSGYGPPEIRMNHETVTVLTPEPMLRTIRAGYIPALHATAGLSPAVSG